VSCLHFNVLRLVPYRGLFGRDPLAVFVDLPVRQICCTLFGVRWI